MIETRRRRVAWILIIVADAGWLVWGLMAAVAPEHLPGPHTASIVVDGYEGFTGNTIAFGVPMSYDRIVNAIGPFELTEYLGIAVIYAALALTASVNLRRSPTSSPSAPLSGARAR